MTRYIIILTFLIAGFQTAGAQSYTLDQANSNLTILGTSTIHDWEIEALELAGNVEINVQDEVIDVAALSISIAVKGLKSGKSAMDKNTYAALLSDQHPYISYRLLQSKSTSTDELSTTGVLTIAGVSKNIELLVKAKTTKDQVNFYGKKTLRMTDFKIDPPTAIMGTIKTGDEITIEFNIQYN